jgi:hypothetical protein
MARLLLAHWNAAEADERAARLAKAGHSVTVISAPQTPAEYRRLAASPLDAVVIDLARLPSHGRELGGWLRRSKASRHLPLVFVEGDPDKTARTRELLPDATFTTWRGIRGAITRAMKATPAKPAVPGAMAGYSGQPLPKKLGVKAGDTVILLGSPPDFAATLGELPADVTLRRRAAGQARIVLLFAKRASELERRWPAATKAVAAGGRLWICWPKQASGVATDVTQALVRGHGLEREWVDFKIAAIDGTWSGLAFARRQARG